MNRGIKYRIYPTKSQKRFIEGQFNACRFVYNVSLDCEQQLYQLGAKSNVSRNGLTYHIKNYTKAHPWLKEYDSVALYMEMDNLANAYKKFFTGGGFPKFKSKYNDRQSFRTYKNSVSNNLHLTDGLLKIPKLKKPIKCVVHTEIEGKLKQATIFRENDKYYVSLMYEVADEIPKVDIKKEVGIDLGLNHFIILDDGRKIDNPKFLKEDLDHLKKLQQNLSRCKKGSNNYKKIKKKITSLHINIKNKRENFLHNLSKEVVTEFDRIYIEDLSSKNMSRSAKGNIENPGKNVKQKSGLNRNILDAGWGKFVTMLDYKSKWNGKEIFKIGKFYPSSKTCSNCGEKNNDLQLSDRIWNCGKCNVSLDRDINAAKNIKAEGRRSLTKV